MSAASAGAQSAPANPVVDLRRVELLPHEIGRFQIRLECSPAAQSASPNLCRQIQALAVTASFRPLDKPTGIKGDYQSDMQFSAAPITKIIGDGISLKQSLGTPSWEVCSIRIVETEGHD